LTAVTDANVPVDSCASARGTLTAVTDANDHPPPRRTATMDDCRLPGPLIASGQPPPANPTYGAPTRVSISAPHPAPTRAASATVCPCASP
jgi:hypothetical protein